jgi:hypothetical protein
LELPRNYEALIPQKGIRIRDEDDVIRRLGSETGLGPEEARFYLRLLFEGSVPASKKRAARPLMEKGMAIVSGDGSKIIPVHPRLGVANQYRTWRELMVREINERRMRVDKLILELIPLYEAATEKKPPQRDG